MHGLGLDQVLLDKALHGICQRLVVQQVVAVETVLVEFVQVDVVQAGTAVNHAIVNDKTLEVQDPEQFPGLYRHAVNRYVAAVGRGLRLIPGGIAGLFAGADQPPLGAQPIHQDHDFKLGTGGFGCVQGVEDFLSGFVLLQVQSHQRDALSGTRDLLQQAATKISCAGQYPESIGGQGEAA